jgi:glycosyltransferase involved in cell wall biosynthesis
VRGGAQAYVLDVLRAFMDRFDSVLGAGEEGHLTDAARGLGIPVHVAPSLGFPVRPWQMAVAVPRLARLIRSTGADLVSAHSTWAGLAGRVAAHRCGVPAIFTAHGWPFAGGVGHARRLAAVPLERMAARRCRRIIVVCDADRHLALQRKIAPAEKLVTVRYGVHDAPERADPGASASPVVAMVARFEPQKDYACLLRALASVSGSWRAVLVGDGPTRPAAESLTRDLGLADRVTFLGSRDDVATVLSSAHLFALATRWEGLPLTILEAMRAGLPVVASNIAGVGEAVADGESGFLVRARDPRELGRRIGQLCRDAALRARMGAAGRRRYEGEFTFERMLHATGTVYEDALDATGNGGTRTHSPETAGQRRAMLNGSPRGGAGMAGSAEGREEDG